MRPDMVEDCQDVVGGARLRVGRNGLRNVGGRIAPGIERDRVIALAEMAELRLVAATKISGVPRPLSS
jgi:hypothetical protein